MERILDHSSPFVVLPFEELEQAQKLLTERRCAKGEWVFREGDPATTLWIIVEGWVHLVRRSCAGRQVTIFTMTPSDALCGLSACEQGVYTAGALVATPCRLVGLSGKYVAALIERYPAFAREILTLERTRIRHMAEAMTRAHDPAACRIAGMLLRLADQFGSTVPVTHRELAQMAGTTLETSIRTTSRFRQQHLVTTQRGKITVTNRARLSRIAGGSGNGHILQGSSSVATRTT